MPGPCASSTGRPLRRHRHPLTGAREIDSQPSDGVVTVIEQAFPVSVFSVTKPTRLPGRSGSGGRFVSHITGIAPWLRRRRIPPRLATCSMPSGRPSPSGSRIHSAARASSHHLLAGPSSVIAICDANRRLATGASVRVIVKPSSRLR